MPSRVIDVSQPVLSLPTQLATQSKQDVLSAAASTSRTTLQATPESSFSNEHGFTIGYVMRVSSNGVRRCRNTAVYASSDQGLVVVDPSTQTATSSHAFSPSLQPISTPLVIQTSTSQIALICLAPRNMDDSAEVHVWSQKRDSASNTLEDDVKHITCKIDTSARSMHALLNKDVLIHHADGSFSLLSGLEGDVLQLDAVMSTLAGKDVEQIWIHYFTVLDRFASSSMTKAYNAASESTILLRISSSNTSASRPKVRRSARKSAIEVIDAAEGTSSISATNQNGSGEVKLEIFSLTNNVVNIPQMMNISSLFKLQDAKDIRDVAMFHSGRLVISTFDGRLLSTVIAFQADGTLIMKPISSISIPATNGQSTNGHLVSIQMVSGSTAILLVADPIKDIITAVICDLELSCILSQSEWNSTGVQTVTLSRIAGSSLLVLATNSDTSNKIATNLWSLSYTINEENHLRWALKSTGLTRKWIGLQSKMQMKDESEKERIQLLKEIERILVNKDNSEASDAIDNAFDKWYRKEASRLESIWLSSVENEMLQEGGDSSDSDNESKFKDNGSKRKAISGKAPSPAFPARFVSALLTFVLPSSGPHNLNQAKSTYARGTVHRLLASRAISYSICPNLVSSLQAVEDWDAIVLILRNVHDLPEIDIVQILQKSIKEASSLESKKRLDDFVNIITSVTLNHAELRIALKTCVQDIQEVIIFMESLSSWLSKAQETLLSNMPQSQNGLKGRKQRQNRKAMVKIDKVLYLLCDLIDTYFPLFLSTQSSHDYLNQLAKQIQGQLGIYNHLTILQGPLAAFAKLQVDQEREAKIEEKKRQLQDEDERLMDLKIANKKAISGKQQNVIGQVGGGTGKNQLGGKSRRRQLYEENVAVGLYSLERLEL